MEETKSVIPTTENPDVLQDQEESLEDRYKRMIMELMCTRSWSPRRAQRFLQSESRRQIKKTMPRSANKTARQLMKNYKHIPVNIRQMEKERQRLEQELLEKEKTNNVQMEVPKIPEMPSIQI